jgi:adhesin transport system outer membrane protein
MTKTQGYVKASSSVERQKSKTVPFAVLASILSASFYLSACNLPFSSSSSSAATNQNQTSPSPDNVTSLQGALGNTLVDGIPVDNNESGDTVNTPSGSVDLPTDSLFANGQYELLPAGIEQLKKVAVLLNGVVTNASLQFIGHTDCPGGPSINNPLSIKRAETVLTWFKKNGLTASNMTATGVGSSPLVCPSSGGTSSKHDRRVEIKIYY